MNKRKCERVILSRYLIKEVFGSLLAVTFILLLIFMSNQLVRYLSYAASGKLAANILLQILAFEVPYLLAILLPLGLYLGIILAYGRLYADNELTIMQACGLSQAHLIRITSVFTFFITLVVLVLMLWVNPYITAKKEHVLIEGMSAENVLDNLMPGRFQVSSDGKRVVYVESISRSQNVADNIFFADQLKTSPEENLPSAWSVVSAAHGYQTTDPETKRRFLIAEEGYRYQGVPGQNDFKIIQFKKYAVQTPTIAVSSLREEKEAFPTAVLWQKYSDPGNAAELQWRFSIPLSALLLSILAIPLSHVRPRQGRFSTVLPAVLIYVVYLNLLFLSRNWIEQKSIPIYLGMWWVHILFLFMVAGYFILQSTYFKRLFKRI